jgi:hypothetical protein
MSKQKESSETHNESIDEKKTELKECFIITPIGKNGSSTYAKTEGLISSVLKPVLLEFGFYPLPAHHIDNSGSINKQIIDKIVNCELVIANLTEINPNVMYELAVRHSFGKKVITLAEEETKLPFDIVDQRTIFYEDSMLGVDILKPRLSKAIESLLKEDESKPISNPVYDAVKQVAAIQGLPSEQQDALSILLDRLDIMDNQLKSINRYFPNRRVSQYSESPLLTKFKVETTSLQSAEQLNSLIKFLAEFDILITDIESLKDKNIIHIKSNFPINPPELKNKLDQHGISFRSISGQE